VSEKPKKTSANAARAAGAGDSATPPPRTVLQTATTAVEMLDVRPFVRKYIEPILSKLEECEQDAASSPVNSDMMFLALTLPVINGVIHIASNPKALRESMAWVTEKWQEPHGDPDPISLLSALTLIYIVVEGWNRYKDDATKSQVWRSMLNHVKTLSQGLEEQG
jgi:hypothetical protein